MDWDWCFAEIGPMRQRAGFQPISPKRMCWARQFALNPISFLANALPEPDYAVGVVLFWSLGECGT